MKSVLEALVRAKLFAEDPQVPANARATRLVGEIGELIADMERAGANQVSGAGRRSRGTARKQILARDILDAMRAIRRTFRSVEDELQPRPQCSFLLPRSQAHQKVLASARAFLRQAEPIKDALIESALPPDFIEQLETLIANFSAAFERAELGRTTHVGGTVTLDRAVRQGPVLLQKLGAVIKNLFAKDPVMLARWKHAAHIQRPPRREDRSNSAEPANSPAESPDSSPQSSGENAAAPAVTQALSVSVDSSSGQRPKPDSSATGLFVPGPDGRANLDLDNEPTDSSPNIVTFQALPTSGSENAEDPLSPA